MYFGMPSPTLTEALNASLNQTRSNFKSSKQEFPLQFKLRIHHPSLWIPAVISRSDGETRYSEEIRDELLSTEIIAQHNHIMA